MDCVESYVFSFSDHSSSESESFSSHSSSASSSIGRNSDDGEEDEFHGGGKSSDDGGENEAESTYKGPLDLMESLEEVLPIRKGISKYYNGKSKSFTNLNAEASSALTSSSSMKDLAKPENPYSRRRRNLLCHQIWETNKTTPPRGGISKKHIMMSSSRSALTLAMAVAAGVMVGEGSCSGGDSSPGSSPTSSRSPPTPRQRHQKKKNMMLPPLYPRNQGSFGNLKSSQSSLGFCAWRSHSVADFPMCLPATTGDS